jgi:BASS family bile acid:Na+ symporter
MNLQSLILIVLQVSVILTVFAIGLRASVQDATYLFRRPGELIRAVLALNVVMPAFAVGLALLFNLHPAVEIALVALAVSPVPPLLPNNVLKAGGTHSYAIGILLTASVLAIIFVPLSMEILRQSFNAPVQMTMAAVAKVVLITTLLPLGLGVAVHSFVPALAVRLAKPISQIAGLALLVSFVVMMIAAVPAMWALVGNGTVIALAAFVLVGLTVGHFLGGPKQENRAALAISTASRHPGVAIAIAVANFPGQKLAIAASLLYLLINVIVTIPYLLWTKRRQPVVQNQVKA